MQIFTSQTCCFIWIWPWDLLSDYNPLFSNSNSNFLHYEFSDCCYIWDIWKWLVIVASSVNYYGLFWIVNGEVLYGVIIILDLFLVSVLGKVCILLMQFTWDNIIYIEHQTPTLNVENNFEQATLHNKCRFVGFLALSCSPWDVFCLWWFWFAYIIWNENLTFSSSIVIFYTSGGGTQWWQSSCSCCH